jgi:hypothetical protein
MNLRHPLRGNGVVLVALLLGSLRVAAAPDVALPNAGFEDLDPATAAPRGWVAWAQPNWAVYSLAAARTGVACVAITDDSETVSQGLRSSRIPIAPGGTYRASVWVKVESLRQGGFALYLEYWQGQTRVANRSVSTATAPDWTPLSLEYPAPPDATEATVLVYAGSTTIGRAYFDDAALTAP